MRICDVPEDLFAVFALIEDIIFARIERASRIVSIGPSKSATSLVAAGAETLGSLSHTPEELSSP